MSHHSDSTALASCEAPSTALPPKKRPRILQETPDMTAQALLVEVKREACTLDGSMGSPADACLKDVESEGSDSGVSEGAHSFSRSYQEAWAGEAMQVLLPII
jgi:hypothetical protein